MLQCSSIKGHQLLFSLQWSRSGLVLRCGIQSLSKMGTPNGTAFHPPISRAAKDIAMTEQDLHSSSTSSSPCANQRVIKKYPNRRLYDTATSTYITLSEVKQLVMAHEPIVVKDAKTGEDLTRAIFLQIILEEEAGGAPMFTEAMLANTIRFYGHTMQGHMGSFIEKNVQCSPISKAR